MAGVQTDKDKKLRSDKIQAVMKRFQAGKLFDSDGKKVTSLAEAMAISSRIASGEGVLTDRDLERAAKKSGSGVITDRDVARATSSHNVPTDKDKERAR